MENKIDLTTQQYGNFVIVSGHGLDDNRVKEINQILDEHIAEVFSGVQTPEIIKWTVEQWAHGPNPVYTDCNKIVNGIEGEPVTLFCWKSKPQKVAK